VRVKTEEWPDDSKPAHVTYAIPRETGAQSLGLTVQSLTRDLADHYRVELTPGVVVTAIERNGLASQKRIRAGDIITELNYKPVHNPKQFNEALKNADLKKGVSLNLMMKEGDSRFVILKDSGE